MNVLSLFDGMSCGLVALKRAGVKVDNYFASEIDKYTILISEKNHPEVNHLGDTKQWEQWELPKIDLFLAGPPCQGFSCAGNRLNFDDPRSKLFLDTIEIMKAMKPDNFLIENVASMKKKTRNELDELIGVKSVRINSNLVSAQNRDRLYWVSEGLKLPDPIEDRNILLNDIIKSPCMGANSWTDNVHIFQFKHGCSAGGIRSLQKCPTVNSQFHNNYFPVNVSSGLEYFSLLPYKILRGLGIIRKFYRHELESLQTLPRGYTESVSYSQAAKMIGNGWTIDVIVEFLKGIK